MRKDRALANRLSRVINQKLEIACRICDITPEDTYSLRKHINKAELPDGRLVYIYAEEKLALVTVIFTDDVIRVRRIRRYQWWLHRIKTIPKRLLRWAY